MLKSTEWIIPVKCYISYSFVWRLLHAFVNLTSQQKRCLTFIWRVKGYFICSLVILLSMQHKGGTVDPSFLQHQQPSRELQLVRLFNVILSLCLPVYSRASWRSLPASSATRSSNSDTPWLPTSGHTPRRNRSSVHTVNTRQPSKVNPDFLERRGRNRLSRHILSLLKVRQNNVVRLHLCHCLFKKKSSLCVKLSGLDYHMV